jgi:hypothetical protein
MLGKPWEHGVQTVNPVHSVEAAVMPLLTKRDVPGAPHFSTTIGASPPATLPPLLNAVAEAQGGAR